MDFPDFIYGFAPKPFLVLSAIRDFFPIGGASESFAEARRVYEALGSGDKLQKVEADDGHCYTKHRRQAAYSWFPRWLKSQADDGAEQDVPIARSEELWATPTGQVATSLQGEDVFSLNLKRYDAAKLNRPALREGARVGRFQSRKGRPEQTYLRHGPAQWLPDRKAHLRK